MAAVGRKSHGLKSFLHRDRSTSRSPAASPIVLPESPVDAPSHPHHNLPPPQQPIKRKPVVEKPPTPPPKDPQSTPRPPSHTPSYSMGTQSTVSEADSYFRPYPLSRAGSVYSLSRVSFSNQISQLTSIQLPGADVLATSISSIPTSVAAARALNEAAAQIQTWMQKAADVLSGLDAADDVSWASAAGKEGVDEVNQAITRFESLVKVIISSVEALHRRRDVKDVPADEMRRVAEQVESIAERWKNIKSSLSTVKKQVQLAMEWEELSDKTLIDISTQIRQISKFIFELEERRHLSVSTPNAEAKSALGLDKLDLLETSPSRAGRHASLSPQLGSLSLPSTQQGSDATNQEDSSLFELSARLQALRAGLDFLPMKIAIFKEKAMEMFPTACAELDADRLSLDQQWERLDADADSLTRELNEDRWTAAFLQGLNRALQMIDYVTKSVGRADESLATDTQLQHAPSTLKKIESYVARKNHYYPAIKQIVDLVEERIKGRQTVNGEIVRLQSEVQKRWRQLQLAITSLDAILEDYKASATAAAAAEVSKQQQQQQQAMSPKANMTANQQQLRDSISSIMSVDRSNVSSVAFTPGSSPASSVALSRKPSRQELPETPTKKPEKPRQDSFTGVAPGVKLKNEKRHSSLPLPNGPLSPRVNLSSSLGPQPHKSSTTGSGSGSSQAQVLSRYNPKLYMPQVGQKSAAAIATPSGKPRWNVGTNTTAMSSSYNFRSLEAPPGYVRKVPSTPGSANSSSRTTPLQQPNFSSSLGARTATPLRHSPLTPVSVSKTRASSGSVGAGSYPHLPPHARNIGARTLNRAASFDPSQGVGFDMQINTAAAGIADITPLPSPGGLTVSSTTSSSRPLTSFGSRGGTGSSGGARVSSSGSGSGRPETPTSKRISSTMIPVPTPGSANSRAHTHSRRSSRNYSVGSASVQSHLSASVPGSDAGD